MKGIILDHNGDFVLSGGRIQVGEADGQIIENVLRANRGEFKEMPVIGGEAIKMLNGTPANPMWCANVKKQIQSVGVSVSAVEMNNHEIIVKQ
jgi:hypothetical protein